ncbi:MAG TPA: NAD(P)-dependent alcohol dehydrogenase [Candidatus Limnocylindrales bacterium]|nr:NAD(P)-dependent alcohol dehydrogenase [Candidatus Limnocylindrales bacterium]
MRAAMRDVYGGPEVVRVRHVDPPVPIEDEVVVRVEAASLNRADLDQLYPRWWFYRLIAGIRRPRNPRLGLDAAGTVEAVGPAVTTFKAGDRVFGDLFAFGMGAFAELACAPQRAFARIPDGVSFEAAACLPHSAILAVQALRPHAGGRRMRAGDQVLIDGGSGNVGPFAIQIAKAWGAEVTATSRAEKVGFVRSLGADHVFAYTSTDITQGGERFDWIVDVDSHHSVLAWSRALKPGGVYVTLGGGTLDMLGLIVAPLVGRRERKDMGLLMGWRPFNRAADDVATVEELVAAGKLRPVIDRRFGLDQVGDALRYMDEGRNRGKVVITIGPGEEPATS